MGDPSSVAKSGADQPEDWRLGNESLKKRYEYIFNNELYADVFFIVGQEEKKGISANKAILSGGSIVFHTMFSENWSSDENEVEIPDIEPAAFVELLRFIYCADAKLTKAIVWSVYYAATKYCVEALKNRCFGFIKGFVDPNDVMFMLMNERSFPDDKLREFFSEILDSNTSVAISSEDFPNIDIETLCYILERDTLSIREIDLFDAVLKWAIAECERKNIPASRENQKVVLERALPLIRYPLMTVEQFSCIVTESGLLSEKEQLSMLLYFTKYPRPQISFNDKPRERSIKIIVKTQFRQKRNHRFFLWVKSSDSIYNVKCMIRKETDLSPNKQSLFLSSEKLMDNYKVANYSITDESSILLFTNE